jgi:ankyrin repeat protein
MSIFEDARNGILVGDRLDYYIKNNPNILNQQDPASGLTPLAIAVVRGFPEEVEQLLKKGAKADALSRNGETPLLLAAWKTTNERPLIIQLLLAKTPSSSVDTTSRVAENKTPLMYAIENKDIDAIKMLRRAEASLTIKNDDGFNAKEVAENTKDSAVLRALDPDKELADIARLTALVVSLILGYIVAWVNANLNGVIRRVFGLNPELDQGINQVRPQDHMKKTDH